MAARQNDRRGRGPSQKAGTRPRASHRVVSPSATLDETRTATSPVPDLEDRILLDRGGVIVVNKPPDLPSTGRSLEDPDCLQYWMTARASGRMVWAVHQLDADTSGLNVFVTRKSLVPVWQKRLRFPTARKSYVAVVHGSPDWQRRRVDAPIDAVERDAVRRMAVSGSGKRAVTRFRVLDGTQSHSVLVCTLETGRTHQIRVHLEHLGLSLVGEEWYRPEPCDAHPRQALHAAVIRFMDGEEPSELRAPLPDDLVALIGRLGLDVPALDDVG